MAALNWIKTGKIVNADGSTVITYHAEGTPWTIESFKRQIPHAGGREGGWDLTTFIVYAYGQKLAEKMRFADAKKFVETYGKGETK